MKLTKEQIDYLKDLHRSTKDKKICDRIKAILLIDQGYSYKQVAAILLLDETSIRRHVEEYFKSQKLVNANKGGDSKLKLDQAQELIEHLQDNTFICAGAIAEYISRKYQVKYSVSGITSWLKQHRFAYKKPCLLPKKHDEEQQKLFIKKLNNLKDEDNPLYFLDATHPEYQSKPSYGWIYKGSRKSIPTTATQKRVHIFGALAYNNKQVIISTEENNINSQSVIKILEQIKFLHPIKQKINIVLDNAKYQKSKIIQEYIADNPNIKLHYLPPYSPNLNLIERVWKFMHKQVTNNTYYDHFEKFKYSILSFLRNINSYSDQLESLLAFKFQKLNYTIANFVKCIAI